MNYRYIVVEGSIGSGKSELSCRLAQHFGALHLTEQPENNPFLMQFYANAANHGLASELSFLMQRTELVESIETEAGNGTMIVADFLLEKDQIFAPVVLNEQEQTLFWSIKRKVMPEYPVPDLVIYLQTGAESNRKRLQKRNSADIHFFPEGYLNKIHDEYSRFFHLYQTAPLLIVNADETDFSGSEEHFDLLLRAIGELKGSRNYLNLSDQ